MTSVININGSEYRTLWLLFWRAVNETTITSHVECFLMIMRLSHRHWASFSPHTLCQSHINTRILSLCVCVVCINTETGQRQSEPDRHDLDHQSPVCNWTDMSSVCVAGQTHLHVSGYLRESSSKDFSSLKHTNRKRLVIKVGHTAEDRQGQCQNCPEVVK